MTDKDKNKDKDKDKDICEGSIENVSSNVLSVDFLKTIGGQITGDTVERECVWTETVTTKNEKGQDVSKSVVKKFNIFVKVYNSKEWIDFYDDKKSSTGDKIFRLIAASVMKDKKGKEKAFTFEQACYIKQSLAMAIFNVINEVNNETDTKKN